MKRKVPRMTTDKEAEAFLEQDLSDLDFSQFKPVKFEFQAKAARLNMRLPAAAARCSEGERQGARRTLHPVYPRGSGTGDSRETGQAPPLNNALYDTKLKKLSRGADSVLSEKPTNERSGSMPKRPLMNKDG